MPTRSFDTSVLRWPDAAAVREALCAFAENLAAATPAITRIGYFGSYARNNWGVGSDLDVIVEVKSSDVPFERRAAMFDFTSLPVASDVFVYTADELRDQLTSVTRFARELRDAIWVYPTDS
jgi:uncharacterized protein